ncbi:aldose 1-epimerase [Mariniflexile ostreae]|uniref:Aldose 1-epimerase n=1 Tax=Mariniflexile ostreae TaxID=1520892 RepID=A0ABV5FD99_9FLAO
MYKIHHHQELHLLELKHSKNKVYAKIHLDQGASLQELTLNGHAVIKNLSPLSYATTYASSILFPFANRIKDGAYAFNGRAYAFEINQKEEHNALHGLVYNKRFEIVEQKKSESGASVILQYIEEKESMGFPYKYIIQLEYTITEKDLSLKVSVTNTDTKAFPFTLGWHPYFSSSDLYNSTVDFNSHQKVILGDRNITTGIEPISPVDMFEVKDQQLDDCYILDADTIVFKTPDYDLQIKATSKDNFLQMYTPPKENTIAIEPTTGVSDSFNNQIGLQVLKPDERYSLTWALKIINQ